MTATTMPAHPPAAPVGTDKDARFWNRQARKYAKSKISDIEGYQRSLARTRDFLSATSEVLEIGCGTGTTALHHAPHVKHITGTDLSSEMVSIANEKAGDADQLNAEFVVAEAARLPFAEDAFDVVMAHNLFHLVPSVDDVLSELHRVTKSGGTFISKTPCLDQMNPVMKRVVLPVVKRIYGVSTLQIFSVDTLRRSILKAGFVIEDTEFHDSKGKKTRPFIVARKV